MQDNRLPGKKPLFLIDNQEIAIDAPPSTSVFLTSVAPVEGQSHLLDVICREWIIIYN